MTHKDIYTKFMIEYDKAGASTSYPSLTEYEVATVLDKAYNALIAQKVTGNNVRRSTFESDIKSIADLGPLVNTRTIIGEHDYSIAPNVYKFDIDKYKRITSAVYTFVHFLSISEIYGGRWSQASGSIDVDNPEIGWDEEDGRFVAVSGNKFYNTTTNGDVLDLIDLMNDLIDAPQSFYVRRYNENGQWYYCHAPETGNVWKLEESESGPELQYAVEDTKLLYFLQGSMLYDGPVSAQDANNNDHFFTTFKLEDESDYNPVDKFTTGRGVPVKLVNHEIAQKFFTSISNIPWIKQPVCFIEGKNLFVIYDPLNPPTSTFRMTYVKQPNTFVKELGTTPGTDGTCSYFDWDHTNHPTSAPESYQFECNSTVAEELISLAVAFALENVESQRLNSKLNMRGLEA